MTPAQYTCCFCGELIAPTEIDPVLVTIALEDDAEQDLHCHWHCLKTRVHPSVGLYVWESEDREEKRRPR